MNLGGRSFRFAALALVMVGSVALGACGEESDSAASSTTATSEKVTSTTATTSTTAGASDPGAESTTTLSGTTNPDQLDMYIGSEQRLPMIDQCAVGTGSVELTATDPAGNTLTVTVHDNSGGVTYRGPSEDREGSVRTADIRPDGSFVLDGIISVADDSSPAPVGLQIAGRCTP